MKIGRTIGAKRERVETESERLMHREKIKRRKVISIVTYMAILAVIVLGIAAIIMGMKNRDIVVQDGGREDVQPTVEIIDEASIGVPRKVREFAGYLEQDLKEYGITLTRAVIPRNKTREIDVYIADFEGYFKLSLDRGTGVLAEDMDRIVRYMKDKGFKGAEYVDLRVQEKAYYKNAINGSASDSESSIELESPVEVESAVEPESSVESESSVEYTPETESINVSPASEVEEGYEEE